MTEENTQQEINKDTPPTETSNDLEKQLLEQYRDQKDKVETLSHLLKEENEKFEEAEAKLVKLLEDDDKTATARYEGLGHVCIVEGAAYASVEAGRMPDVMEYVKGIGREDMIKESIHSSTLSTFVRELLKRNDPLPPGVTFYKPKTLRFYQAKS